MENKRTGLDALSADVIAPHSRTLPAQVSRVSVREHPHELQAHQMELEARIAELQRENSSLRESSERYADLCEFAPVGYLMLTHMGKISKTNALVAGLLGVEIRGLRQRHFKDFILPDYHDDWHRDFMDMIRSGKRQDSELMMRRGDGETFHARVIPLGSTSYGDDRVVRIALTDITEQKRSERESIALLQRYRILMNTSIDGIHILDLDGNLLEANDAFCHMLGYSQEEAADLNVEDWDAKWTGEELRSIFRETLGTSRVIETLHRRKDGVLLDVEISVSNTMIGGNYCIFAASRDVTERKRAERELLQTSEQLHELMAKYESSREAERRAIAREVHDELGQLLSTLRLDVSMIRLRFCKDNSELMGVAQNMTRLVDSAIHGVRNVSENLRPAALQMGIVAAIEWLCGNFSIQTGMQCYSDLPDGNVDLEEARAVVVFRIVQESLTNIIRHAHANSVWVVVKPCDDVLYVEVKDNGRGFDMNELDQRPSLGLLGMRERAWALGGHLDVASAVGKGTTISICLSIDSGLEKK